MLFGTAVGWAVPAERVWAQAGDAARATFEVPAGPLEDALNRFARQAGITLSFDPALVRGKQADALSGSLTITEGLAALLLPHRLEAARGSSGAYSVQPAAQAQAAGNAALPTLTVTAEAEHADGPVHGYVAQRSATATRTDTPLIETPRAVTVVTREQMDDQAVHTVEQSLRYSAGVLTEVKGYDPRLSSLTVRGFAPAEFLDGFKLYTSNAYSGWLIEPQGLERVELLKGPGAVYDPAAPGGVINMVSKRPSAEAVREVGLSIGNNDRYQGSFDLGGALNADGSLMFRLNGLFRSSSGQTDFSRDDRNFIAPALTWKPSSRTKVTLLAEVTRDRMTPESAWPVGALITPNPNGGIPRDRFVGEPGVDHYNRNASSVTYLLEHQLNDNWTLRQNARYAALDIDYQQVYGESFQSDQRTLNRGVRRLVDKSRTSALDTQIEGRFRTGPVAHTLLLGMDYQRYVSDKKSGVGPASSIDAFAPVYGAPVTVPVIAPVLSATALGSAVTTDGLTQRGLYVQDQMRSGPWSLGLAVRRDQSRNSYSGSLAAAPGPDTKTTYNAGLLYLASNGLAPYFSYSTSFTPLPGALANGTLFKPELGRQLEVGLKYRPPGLDALFTISAFDLRKNNVTTFNPYLFSPTAQIGEVRTRGPEFEARAALTKRLKLVASYTFLDAKVTRSLNPLEVGKQPVQTARKTASLWLDYRFGNSEWRGWSLGGGVRYVDKVPASTDNSLYNPAYTLVDAALRYEHGPYTFALNATNLFNKTYVAGYGQYYGQGRALQAKATFRW
ncbi:TonB-dependent siderophore receptor [Variovorax sp. PAMC26660]|uniref:TonB-dependent siderophore receptor n=1 Tax=Variovorax sp. PAMC26660 TaxID=2762322 RepID=UPI00164DAECB|nr:TonB-dependent siderophore receptor [Variovorax sp. PAMC26660]QNK70968.1 TonB-dependent siderophore receptor [Variovorax sp. PAMC26660]